MPLLVTVLRCRCADVPGGWAAYQNDDLCLRTLSPRGKPSRPADASQRSRTTHVDDVEVLARLSKFSLMSPSRGAQQPAPRSWWNCASSRSRPEMRGLVSMPMYVAGGRLEWSKPWPQSSSI